ncbi:uncharacterized protein C1orf131 homolog isoform X2 [Scyliorhinus canicula]|uniref:uncharacterized protein C1orf131 homolog isoform X2 n=1 Tax=Scyliorhinus canicula TaxID=7830 RepID=UPI0018F3BF92|nr:uncharacterized protein C1orf131 homolog isoform X2 [Scyliorhinus canicula]
MGESERLVLDEFLSRLYQCGEASVSELKDKGGKIKLKGRIKQKKNEEQTLCPEVQSVPCSTTQARTSDSLAKSAASSLHRTPKCLVKLRAELLDSVDDCAVQAETKGAKVPSDGIVNISGKKAVEVITFTGSRKRKKPIVEEDKVEETVEQNNTKQKVFNLARARLEVHRFGITGYKKERQRLFEQERAVMLGARNSKSTLPRRKKEERRNKRSEIIPTGQVGRFKNGTLILSDNDIKRIKTRTKPKHV